MKVVYYSSCPVPVAYKNWLYSSFETMCSKFMFFVITPKLFLYSCRKILITYIFCISSTCWFLRHSKKWANFFLNIFCVIYVLVRQSVSCWPERKAFYFKLIPPLDLFSNFIALIKNYFLFEQLGCKWQALIKKWKFYLC